MIRHLKKRRRDLICPRSTLKTPQTCSRAKTLCCSSHLALCACARLSGSGAPVSRLEAELVEQVRPLSHESLQTRAWRKQRQPSAGELRSDRNNHRRSAFKTLCQSSETGIQRRPKESTDSPQKRLNYFIEINSLLSQ